jgi:alpha/beta superfamily hydrolase
MLPSRMTLPHTNAVTLPAAAVLSGPPGMGAQKDMGLHQYACAFVAGGLAALVFDYRSFGGSEGEPRQWVSPSRHVQDWQSAVDYAKQQLQQQVDCSKMCLWGTSFAGGHVLVTAARNPANVVAVVSQVRPSTTNCVHSNAYSADLQSLCSTFSTSSRHVLYASQPESHLLAP